MIREQRGKIDHDQVRFLAGVEGPDDFGFSERACAALGGEIKSFARTERPKIRFVGATRFLNFNLRAHDLPHIELGPSGHVRAQADVNSGLEKLIELHQTAAEKKI